MIRKPAAILFVLSLAVLALALVPAVGLAAKGGNGGGGKPGGGGGGKPGGTSYTGTLGGPVMVADYDADGAVSHGDSITFNVTSNAPYYFVALSCYQSGVLVYRKDAGFYVGWPWGQDYMLVSSAWQGGSAECNAELYSQRSDGSNRQTLATMGFSVAA